MIDGLLVAFVASLLLGVRHATDGDHVVAITTIVEGNRPLRDATRIGMMWGLGHSCTILVVGGAIILLKVAFTPRLGLSLEFSVAAMLMVLGLLNLRNSGVRPRAIPPVRPFLIGTVHGMAGSAAAALLVLPLFEDTRWAILYLGVFGLGTIAGMALVTISIAAPAAYAGARLTGLHRGIRIISGGTSLAFGAYLGYQVGFVQGLFTSQPVWIPR
jgi:high-affinity nickel-transport protein